MMRFWNYSRVLATGAPAPNATVTVFNLGTLVPSTIYADNLEPPTPLANPFSADADGYLYFYADNGHYDVRLSGVNAGIPVPYTWPDVLMQDVGGGPLGIVQAQLGGSLSNAPVVTGSPAVVEAIEYRDILIPWTKLPLGAVVSLEVYGKPDVGASIVAQLFDLTSAAVVLTDPNPFVDDTQFVKHTIPLTPALVDQVVRLRATVTNGDSLLSLFYGDLLFS